MNEEQRKQRDARVAELVAETVAACNRCMLGSLYEDEAAAFAGEIRTRINLALDEQAKQIAGAIEAVDRQDGQHDEFMVGAFAAARVAAGFGDGR